MASYFELRLLQFSTEDFIRHQTLFFSLKPNRGYLSAHKSRAIFVQSRIALHHLSQIWKLIGKGENDEFSLTEFSTCLRLIQAVICGMKIPTQLPITLEHKQYHNVLSIPVISKERAGAYELIFYWLKPAKNESLEAKKVLNFISCSKLTDAVLGRIWTYCDIDCDDWLSYEEFVISLHLTIFCKTENSSLDGVVDTYKLFPAKLRQESTSEKENRLIDLQLRRKELHKRKQSVTDPETLHGYDHELLRIDKIEQNLKADLNDPSKRISDRTGLEKLFHEDFIKKDKIHGADYVRMTRQNIKATSKLNEPASIFEGDNIISYSKTLVVAKKKDPLQRTKSDVRRKLTSELLALTEDIERLRRETSSNFEELNKEFEQVKASVGKEEEEFPDVFVSTNENDETDSPLTNLTNKNKKKASIVTEDVISSSEIRVEESSIDFCFEQFDRLDQNISTETRGRSLHKEESRKSHSLSPTNRKNSSKKSRSLSRDASLKRDDSKLGSKSRSLSRDASLKRNDSKRGSSKRGSFRKRNKTLSPDRDLASDFNKIFEKLSLVDSSQKPTTKEDDIKTILDKVSVENKPVETNKETKSSRPSSLEIQTVITVEEPPKQSVKAAEEPQRRTSRLQESLEKRRQEYLDSLKYDSVSPVEPQADLQQTLTNELKPEQPTEELNTRAVFQNSLSIFENKSVEKQLPHNKSTLVTDEKLNLTNNNKVTVAEEKHEVHKIKKRKSKKQRDKNAGVSKEVHSSHPSKENKKFYDDYKRKSSTLPRSTTKSTTTTEHKYIDRSVSKLLRNLSFRSNARENPNESEDVKTILRKLSIKRKSKNSNDNVQTILSNLSYKKDEEDTMEEKGTSQNLDGKNQNEDNLSEHERRRLAFDYRRKVRRSSSKTKEGKVVVLDKQTIEELRKTRDAEQPMKLFYTGTESFDSLIGNNESRKVPMDDLDSLIANNTTQQAFENLNQRKYESMNHQTPPKTRHLSQNGFQLDNSDMFFKDDDSEKRQHEFIRSKSDASGLTENQKNKLIMKTKNGRVVKNGPGLLNRNDPSQVTFQKESEWLEKLCGDHVEAMKNKDPNEEKKKRPLSKIEVGSPFLPSDESDGRRSHNVTSSESEMEQDAHRLKSKSIDVVEEPIQLNNSKIWLENLVIQGDLTPRSDDNSSRISDLTPRQISFEKQTTPKQNEDHVETRIGNSRIDPVNQFISPQTTTIKEAPKTRPQNVIIPKDVVSEKTKLNEVMSPTEDDESRGNAYMLPSALRKQKQDGSIIRTPIQSKEKIEPQNSNSRQSSLGNNFTSSPQVAAPDVRQPEAKTVVNKPKSSMDLLRETTPNDVLKGSRKPTGSNSQIHHSNEENGGDFHIPSVKDKMRMFMNTSQTDDVILRKQPVSKTNSRPKSFHGSTFNQSLSLQNAPVIDLNNNNDDVDTKDYKNCVKDARILQEIQEMERREKEIRLTRTDSSAGPSSKQQQRVIDSNNNNNSMSKNSFNVVASNNNNDTTQQNGWKSQQQQQQQKSPSRTYPAGLAAFLQENEVH